MSDYNAKGLIGKAVEQMNSNRGYSINDIASMLNIGNTTARILLRQMEAEGLVTKCVGYRGSFIYWKNTKGNSIVEFITTQEKNNPKCKKLTGQKLKDVRSAVTTIGASVPITWYELYNASRIKDGKRNMGDPIREFIRSYIERMLGIDVATMGLTPNDEEGAIE